MKSPPGWVSGGCDGHRGAGAPVNLRSDNVAGIAPEILAAIEAANAGSAPSYGADPITARLQDIFSELFETACFVQPVATGTATNALALALIAPPYGAIYCTDVGHVHDSECGAGEFYTGGARIVPLAAEHGRLRPETLRAALQARRDRAHRAGPAGGAQSHPGDRARHGVPAGRARRAGRGRKGIRPAGAHGRRALRQRDRGARLRPADVTWRRGVDVLSFGATKNGAMGAEAVVVFSEELAEPLRFRARRAGQVFSKMRFISAQLEAYLEGRAVAASGGARQCHGRAPGGRARGDPRRPPAASGREQRDLRRHAASR